MGVHMRIKEQSKRKKALISLLSAAMVAIGLSVLLVRLFNIKPSCSYSRYVHEIGKNDYVSIENMDIYRYGIDCADYVRDEVGNIYDYYGLIQISGWEVVRQGESWHTSMDGILLESDNSAYRIDTEMRKKTDIPYLDQSDPESKELDVAFFTYVPQDSLSTGTYRIGILVQEDRQDKVLWTESTLEVQ